MATSPTRDYKDSSWRSLGKRSTSYLNETNSITYEHDKRFIIEEKKGDALEDENMETDVQVIEYHELPNIKSNDVNNLLEKFKLPTTHHMQMKYIIREHSF